MISFKNLNITLLLLVSSTLLISCGGKFPGADARKYSKDPEKRVAKNIEEGKGFRLLDGINLVVEFLSLQVLMNYGERR